MSAVNALEAAIVAEARKHPAAGREFDLLLHRAQIDVVPVDDVLVEESRRMWREYGKRNHPAGLNFCAAVRWHSPASRVIRCWSGERTLSGQRLRAQFVSAAGLQPCKQYRAAAATAASRLTSPEAIPNPAAPRLRSSRLGSSMESRIGCHQRKRRTLQPSEWRRGLRGR